MVLTTLIFAIFCIITLLIYFVVPKKIQWIILFVSSFIFLFYNNLTIGTICQAVTILLTTYFSSILIEKSNHKKRYLLLGIGIILGLLIYLKYTNLFLVSFNHILGMLHSSFRFSFVKRNSLIGVSYYSLIMISYLIDIYRGAIKPQKNIFKLGLFMSYFPILTSGPFIRYKDIESDLYGRHKFNYERMRSGLIRILWGLFKILVISERLGYFIDTVWGNLEVYSGAFSIIAILFFPLQLYTNFSGSIDIIMGISEIIGINLPENFNTPFFSKTVTELWRRWHITLGAWLKDYIFYPLQKSDFMQKIGKICKNKFGKKIGKKIPLYLSMLLMWILIGAWHGGLYTFIIGSGILQFIFIFLEDTLQPISKKINKKLGIKEDVFSYKLYQIVRTYLLFSFAMIFFRAGSVSNAISMITNVFKFKFSVLSDGVIYMAGLDRSNFKVLIISLFILFVVQLLKRSGSVREKLFNQNIVFRWAIIYILIFSIIIFGCYGPGYDSTTFIYRQF